MGKTIAVTDLLRGLIDNDDVAVKDVCSLSNNSKIVTVAILSLSVI